jgi:hypothetical protein
VIATKWLCGADTAAREIYPRKQNIDLPGVVMMSRRLVGSGPNVLRLRANLKRVAM